MLHTLSTFPTRPATYVTVSPSPSWLFSRARLTCRRYDEIPKTSPSHTSPCPSPSWLFSRARLTCRRYDEIPKTSASHTSPCPSPSLSSRWKCSPMPSLSFCLSPSPSPCTHHYRPPASLSLIPNKSKLLSNLIQMCFFGAFMYNYKIPMY